ncbi:AEC family transporter [Bacillaceae bacterium]
MDVATILSSILVMACMIGIGYLLTRCVPFSRDAREMLVGIIVYAAMPSIILSSVFRFPVDAHLFRQLAVVFLLSIVISSLGILIGWGLSRGMRIPSQKAREMAVVSGLGNTGFIGLPLCAALFGPKGALFAAVFDAGVDFTMWTLAVLLLQKRASLSIRSLKAMLNVPFLAILAGLALTYAGWHPPQLFNELTGRLAGLASPLAMMYIGMLLPGLRKRNIHDSLPYLRVPLAVKLLLIPAATACLLSWAEFDPLLEKVALVQSTMPTLTIASVLFAKFSADEEIGATATIVSTLLSLSTIPVIVSLMGGFIH